MKLDPKTEELYHECHRLFMYDDGDLIRKVSTGPRSLKGDIAGSINGSGYVQTYLNKKIIRNDAIIFLMHSGYIPKQIDHIDRNPGNNRISNLRECDYSTNGLNVGLSKTNTSGFKGVYICGRTGKFVSQIRINKATINIGTYTNKLDAAKSYDLKVTEHHGDFGITNKSLGLY